MRTPILAALISDANANLTNAVTSSVLCVAGSCGSATTCDPMGVNKESGGD